MPIKNAADVDEIKIEEATREEQLAVLDREAKKFLNMSGEEFARKWREGEFKDSTDPHVTRIAMLLPDAW